MDGKPLSKKDTDVIFWWLKYRNELRVAQRTHLNKAQVKATLERIEVQEEIERQENVLITERMRIQANAENLTNDLLDKELLSIITLDAETHAEAKRRAIEMGYILTGRIESGNTRSLEAKEGPDAKPNFYQAFVPVGIPVAVSPILPEEVKNHQFEIAPPPAKPDPPQGTAHSKPPQSGKVRIF